MNPSTFTIINEGQPSGILFIHGFLGDRTEFSKLAKRFEKSMTIIYVDLPGHGSNTITHTIEFRDVAEQYANLIRSQPTKKWHVVGYSLGGRIALYMAAKWPDLVQQLTLISASPGIQDEKMRRARFQSDCQLSRRIEYHKMETFISFWYRQKIFEPFSKTRVFQESLKKRLQNQSSQVSKALVCLSTGIQPPLWGQLSCMQTPTEIIFGQLDHKFTAIALEMKKRNPNFKLTQVAKCGHVVHLEAADILRVRLEDGCRRMEKCQSV